MLKNYFKIAWRNLLRNKLFSSINIFGLAIGMSACFLIVQYVDFEKSYDDFHKNGDRIYRVILESDEKDFATNHPGTGPAMKADFPEVESYARVVHQDIFNDGVSIWSQTDENNMGKVFSVDRVYNVEPSFLTMFSFPFIYGNPESAFPDRSSVVISESVSNKFFGPENPVGKTLVRNGRRAFKVTGVFKDIPENSHIKFDILVSYFMTDAWGGGWDHSWDWVWAEYFTYIRLKPQTNIRTLEARMPAFAEKVLSEYMKRTGRTYRIRLQPITDIHLNSSSLSKEIEVRGNENTIYFLSIIAVLILMIAWINYVNLSTSKSVERAREIGVRKVAGASKRQLVGQFLLETLMVNFLALFLSFILVITALPFFNQLTGKNIGSRLQDLSLINDPNFWTATGVIFILGSLLAGVYPALVLSSFRITSILKGKFFGTGSGIAIRKVLVGSQFIISVGLIAGTIMVFRQITYMQTRDLGYDRDQLLVIKSPQIGDSTLVTRMQTFKTELTRNPSIRNITSTSEVPGKLISQLNGIRNIGEGLENAVSVYHLYADKDFTSTYGIDLLAGRNFREDDRLGGTDYRVEREKEGLGVPIIINEKVSQLLGFQNAEETVNRRVYFGLGTRDWTAEIVGVFENHHQQSPKGEYDPVLFFPAINWVNLYLTVNMDMANAPGTISSIEDLYKASFSDNPFEYFFLDDFFNRQYAADRQFGKVFGLFSLLALIVATLGLFGLSTFMISQRTKEIAVRKILGATIHSMVAHFSGDFLGLIVIANLIALPAAYIMMNLWLDNFAFRVQIGWIVFIAPVVILLIITLSTVSVQTIKTGLVSPVRYLRQE